MSPRPPTPAQRRAADPAHSVWVTANAGTGKTRVLSDRVLRLLLEGANPESILCITFTKAAAAEMRLRVEARLAGWAVEKDEAAFRADLENLIGEPADARRIARARRLFARVLDLPQGLGIMTIHALCGALLRRFPLEARVAPHFEIIDERTASELLAEARERVFGELRRQDPALDRAIETLAVSLAEVTLGEVLEEVLANRTKLREIERRHGGIERLLEACAKELDIALGLEPNQLVADACADGIFDHLNLFAAARALGNTSPCGRLVAEWLNATPDQRVILFEHYKTAFLTQEGRPRTQLVTQKLERMCPHGARALALEQARIVRLEDRCKAVIIYRRTEALLRVAHAVIEAYEAEKVRISGLDYDDLIEKTRALLGAPRRVEWVLYKLDARIDHVLVDEAQDTSPAQWEVIERLTDEFFTGLGARETSRTLFVVGDEKQSIYSFQGADLQHFRKVRDRLEERALAAGRPIREETLDRSFRSTRAVLEAVDLVLSLPEARPGLVDPDRPVHHETERVGEPGLVEVWPLAEARSEAAQLPSWPLPDQPRDADDPDRRVAEAIARTIRGWLDREERLEATGQKIRPGDVLILLSRRGALQERLVRALKRRHVPVAGADRLALASHIAVMDLIALGRAILLPEDDLTLAALLKSPLLGLTEEELFELAWNREPLSLLERLRAAAAEAPARFAAVYDRLAGWMRRADFMPPFEFYAEVLGRDGGRRRLLERLGPDAAEPIEAFLGQALAYEQGHVASLEGFLHWLQLDERELKRDPETVRDAVRVMTVHGAKGLEAPIVFLADCGPQQPPRGGKLVWRESDGLPFWCAARAARDEVTAAVVEARLARERQERRRLLYVALTRARDRLYVVGRRARKEGKEAEPCWHELVRRALMSLPDVEIARRDLGQDFEGDTLVLRRGTAAARAAVPPEALPAVPLPLPSWATRPAPEEPPALRPVAPSRWAESEPPPSSPLGSDAERRFRFGRHVHKLLQLLPDLPPEARARALARYLEGAADLEPPARARLAQQVMTVLDSPELAPVFGPGSRGEQAICGTLGGLGIAGQIDRMAVTPEAVWLVDYKTNRQPPERAEDTPLAYLRQLACYRALLCRLYPDRPVHAALVWTEGPRVDRLEPQLLDAHMPRAATGSGPPALA